MNLDNTTQILNKINRLYQIITDIGDASSTEKDLLKAYIKEFYREVSDGEELPESRTDTVAERTTKEVPVIKAEPKAEEPVQEVVAQQEPDTVEETPVEPAPEVSTKKEPTIPTANPKSVDQSSMEELFELDEITELSDKLSASPIHDLTKAMGINEKIFTVNELFGGNQSDFDNMMVALNGLNNYDEAKKVLMQSVAIQQDWSSTKNFKKARNFVKLIQRRFK